MYAKMWNFTKSYRSDPMSIQKMMLATGRPMVAGKPVVGRLSTRESNLKP